MALLILRGGGSDLGRIPPTPHRYAMMLDVAVTDEHPTGVPATLAHTSHGVDPQEEPSADWGWHGSFPRAGKLAGWVTAIALFAMLIGNHTSHVEDVYLIGLGTLLVVMLLASHLKAYRARRR